MAAPESIYCPTLPGSILAQAKQAPSLRDSPGEESRKEVQVQQELEIGCWLRQNQSPQLQMKSEARGFDNGHQGNLPKRCYWQKLDGND